MSGTTSYDSLGRLKTVVVPNSRLGAPGTFLSVSPANPGRSHRKYTYPLDASGDPQFDDGCMTGQNTVVVFYGADNVNWDSTRSSQCGLDHRSWDMANHMTLYHYGARYYDPTLHQFTQPDTITPNPRSSLDWNRYAYARNNPLTYTDPSGHIYDNPDHSYSQETADYYTSIRQSPVAPARPHDNN